MKEQEFQLELERFKQKASWENKIFYIFLGFLISVILFYIQQGKVGENGFLWWLGGLGVFLIVGELLINCYLNKQMEKIRKKIPQENIGIPKEGKIKKWREKRKEKKLFKIKLENKEIKKEIKKLKYQIKEIKKELFEVKNNGAS